jgi:hypothetical protein
MHVYLRDEPIRLQMRRVDTEGLGDEGESLTPIGFWVVGNDRPSFRAMVPSDTLAVLTTALAEPVRLGLLAEEPEDEEEEVHGMVGVTLPAEAVQHEDGGAEDPTEPWKADPEAWKGGDDEEHSQRTVLLAFAPLVRLRRRFPADFSAEIADLLERAIEGDTRPSLQARVEQQLGDL